MSTEVGRKLSEQDKALAAELGRSIGTNARDVPTTMPGAPSHTPLNKNRPDGQAERYRSLTEDQKPKGGLAARMEQQRERPPAGQEPTRTREPGRER